MIAEPGRRSSLLQVVDAVVEDLAHRAGRRLAHRVLDPVRSRSRTTRAADTSTSSPGKIDSTP